MVVALGIDIPNMMLLVNEISDSVIENITAGMTDPHAGLIDPKATQTPQYQVGHSIFIGSIKHAMPSMHKAVDA